MILNFLLAVNNDNNISVNLWTVVLVLAAIALVVFIVRNFRR